MHSLISKDQYNNPLSESSLKSNVGSVSDYPRSDLPFYYK